MCSSWTQIYIMACAVDDTIQHTRESFNQEKKKKGGA